MRTTGHVAHTERLNATRIAHCLERDGDRRLFDLPRAVFCAKARAGTAGGSLSGLERSRREAALPRRRLSDLPTRRKGPQTTAYTKARHPAGIALLEVLVALTLVSVAGGALLQHIGAVSRAQWFARAYEEQLEDADRLMRGLTLLTRAELVRQLGVRRVGPYDIAISPVADDLFRLTISERAGHGLLLITEVYAPEGEKQ